MKAKGRRSRQNQLLNYSEVLFCLLSTASLNFQKKVDFCLQAFPHSNPFSDLQSEHLDSHSVVTYLMTLYLSLIGKSSVASAVQPQPSFELVQSTATAPLEILPQEPSTSTAMTVELPPTPSSPLEKAPERTRPMAQQSVDQGSEVGGQILSSC